MNTLTLHDELALLGFFSRKTESLTAGRLQEVLKSVLQSRHLNLGEVLPRLTELSLIESQPLASLERSLRWRLAAPGHEFMQSRLGDVEEVRLRGWIVKAARALLAGRALGLGAETAAVLAAHRDALATFHLAARLGVKFAPGMTARTLAREMTAVHLGIANASPRSLWLGLFERALAAAASSPPAASAKNG